MSEKQKIKDRVQARRRELYAALKPQWKACRMTRPLGHVYDGTHGRNHYYKVCLYCGKPETYGPDDNIFLEKCLAEMHHYPIARGEEKGAPIHV